MARCRFVRPETTILTISEGDTLVVRKRLTHGERQAQLARIYVEGQFNPERVRTSLVTAYLLDWSLVDFEGHQIVIREQPIEVLESALNQLDPDDFDEIRKAIEAHANAVQKARTEEKKLRAGANGSSVTSTSLGGAAGATSGSKNLTAMSTT
jgi:hypothetical protein